MSNFVPKVLIFSVSTDGSYCLRSWSCRFVHDSFRRDTGINVSNLLGVEIGSVTDICGSSYRISTSKIPFLLSVFLSLLCVPFFVSLQLWGESSPLCLFNKKS